MFMSASRHVQQLSGLAKWVKTEDIDASDFAENGSSKLPPLKNEPLPNCIAPEGLSRFTFFTHGFARTLLIFLFCVFGSIFFLDHAR